MQSHHTARKLACFYTRIAEEAAVEPAGDPLTRCPFDPKEPASRIDFQIYDWPFGVKRRSTARRILALNGASAGATPPRPLGQRGRIPAANPD